MFKKLTSFLLATILTLGIPLRSAFSTHVPLVAGRSEHTLVGKSRVKGAEAPFDIAAAEERKPFQVPTKNLCSETDALLEQKVNSWFAPREQSHRRTAAHQPSAGFNPYRYNFYHFGWFYPFATSGMFPQQYLTGGTLVSIPQTNFLSSVLRLQLQGTSDYLTTREFSPLIEPQAELTLAFLNPEAQRNTLRYYLRDAYTLSSRAKAFGAGSFYSSTPGLLFRFRAEERSSQAQVVLSRASWFIGLRYFLEEESEGMAFLLGRENFYLAVAEVPKTKSTSMALFAQGGIFHYSVTAESTPERWQVMFTLLGSLTEAELLGK